MDHVLLKRFTSPDETRSFEKGTFEVVRPGLHAFVECDAQVQIEQLVQNCLHQGIFLTNLTHYYAAAPGRRGVVLGYGRLELHEIAWAGKQIVSQVQTNSQW